MSIKAQVEQGVYRKDIVASLGVHPKTVLRALKRGGPPSKKRRRVRGIKLEAFKAFIVGLLAAGVRNGMVVYREIQERGYEGKYTVLCEYLRPKPLRVLVAESLAPRSTSLQTPRLMI